MYLKKVVSKYKDREYEYGKIVRTVKREDGQNTQEVIKNLGRMESEEDWKRARSILESMKKGEEVIRLKELEIDRQLEFGGIWAGLDVWRNYGIRRALAKSFEGRKTEYNLGRLTFLLVVNRFYEPSSDLAAHRWISRKAFSDVTDVQKKSVYRTLERLVGEKDEIERRILEELKDNLEPNLDLVFYDLTSTYFEGEGPDLADFGYSRDGRSDKVQIVLGVVMADGIPIAHEVWPGNTTDRSTLEEAVKDLKERFDIRNVVFVADRGLISSDNLEELKKEGFDYILATERRKGNLAKKLLMENVPGEERIRTTEVHSEDDKRYILCLNEERREKDLKRLKEGRDKCDKELWKLKDRFEESQEGRGRPMTEKGALKRAEKIIRGYKRIFDLGFDETLTWDLKKEAWEYERAIAGKFLLVTTSDLDPSKTVEKYKELKDVERAFDELKNMLNLRPVYHSTDVGVKGHVFVCILALLLRRLMEKETGESFESVFEELKELKVNVIDLEGEKIFQRNRLTSTQEDLLESLKVKRPPKILVNPE
ncbi:hypothetical protein AKJ49_01450 [candidate division MSBL1 archaeon SCGC-AAA382A03]|uniref:Transposase IS4-like domain-containing protein n=1 Tax=candidate division MSBL1 archaeon SCGC-AAA382A03 TaxID=1698278 RepID=A0A133VF35_9EURY|nr:hypothetical protein AKJ49_01450 [candidate division MSBL1 archaeon SCGC-AAA382A03]